MIGVPPINRIPRGFLDFFGIKGGDAIPRQINGGVAPTFDMFRWYADANSAEFRFVPTGSPFAGNNSSAYLPIAATSGAGDITTGGELVVPQTEIWFVLEGDIFWTTGADAANSADFTLSSGTDTSSMQRAWPMSTGYGFTTGSAVSRSGGRVLTSPYILLPGQITRVLCNGVLRTSGNIDVTGRIRLFRCIA